jgi:hypothetical protein
MLLHWFTTALLVEPLDLLDDPQPAAAAAATATVMATANPRRDPRHNRYDCTVSPFLVGTSALRD